MIKKMNGWVIIFENKRRADNSLSMLCKLLNFRCLSSQQQGCLTEENTCCGSECGGLCQTTESPESLLYSFDRQEEDSFRDQFCLQPICVQARDARLFLF